MRRARSRVVAGIVTLTAAVAGAPLWAQSMSLESETGPPLSDDVGPSTPPKFTQAVPRSSVPGAIRLNVIEDEAVVANMPEYNFHANRWRGGLFVGTGTVSPGPARSYLKFDLSLIQPKAFIAQATLHMYFNDEQYVEDRNIGVYTAGDAWSETSLTWNNRPAITAGPHDTIVKPFTSGQWYSWNVTAPVAAEAAGDGVLTLVIREVVENTDVPTWNYFAEKDYSADLAAYIEIQLDSSPLHADAGDDQTVEATSPDGVEVTLDGTGSTGAEPLTCEWFEGSTLLATGAICTVGLPLGVHTITLLVTDAAGQTDSDTVEVTVEDTTPPEVALTVVKNWLWPPNHKMHRCLTVSSSDVSDPALAVAIMVTANEPLDPPGSRRPDWLIVETDDGAWDIWLRAERAGFSTGREYTVTAIAADASLNMGWVETTVVVPHSRGRR